MALKRVEADASKRIADAYKGKPLVIPKLSETKSEKADKLLFGLINWRKESWASEQITSALLKLAKRKLVADLRTKCPVWELSKSEPIILTILTVLREDYSIANRLEFWHLLLYQNCFYKVTGDYSPEQMKLLVFELADKERKKFERLRSHIRSETSKEIGSERTRIPEDVRIAIWRRDQGKCVRCESRENLEYDHIIPISQGGSNTVRNIELLCEKCNRSKGNKIQ